MTATPPASWIRPIACCGVRPAAGDEGFGAGHQVLLEEGAEVAGRAGGLGDVGAADRVGAAGLADRVVEGQVEAEAAQVLDDLPGPGAALVLGALAGRLDLLQVDPVAADMEVFGVLVDAGHLHRGHDLDPVLRPASSASGTPATESWSESASVVTPALAASATTSAGAS